MLFRSMAVVCEAWVDRRTDCHNCGEGGHKRAECKNEKRCPLCCRDGHRAGESGCVIFRRALRAVEEEKRGRDSEGRNVRSTGGMEKTRGPSEEAREEKKKEGVTGRPDTITNQIETGT